MNTEIDLSKFLCVIPARGGSVEIPKKNLRLVGGYPLVEYSIQHALDNGIPPENIYVSSDDDDILNIACDKFRVVAHERPNALCTGTASSESALIDAYEHNKQIFKTDKPDKKDKDYVIMLQPTSPIRMKNRLTKCIEALISGGYDSLLTTTKLHDLMWFQYDNDEQWFSSYPPKIRPMRQQMDRSFVKHFDNGNIYITSSKVLIKEKCRIGDNPCIYPISWIEGQQIDSFDELEIADMILKQNIDWITSVKCTNVL